MNRRKFIGTSSLVGVGLTVGTGLAACSKTSDKTPELSNIAGLPVTIGTWTVPDSTKAAWDILSKGGSALDAVEQGCKIEEANAQGKSVGIGGLPDRDGNVTLDASIMNARGECGSVVYLKNIVHAISVARLVMENTPHVMLAGQGAEKFALENGFPKQDLLTEDSKRAWEDWTATSEYKPIINIENHDTIGMLALDKNGDLSGGCTTSGLAYKMAGRVGDSPIIGAGLFVDNQIGAAAATGLGEEVVKTVGSFLIVELMRQGRTPQEACKEAIHRIVSTPGKDFQNFQVGYIAVNKKGETGCYSIHKGFTMTRYQGNENQVIESEYYDV